MSESTTIHVATAYGTVSGLVENGIARFLGIPYAAAPRGIKRFAAPDPPVSWTGVRAAHTFGATPPQLPMKGKLGELFLNPVVEGEEYLNLNVWTPDPGATGAPVLVWIHGGGFTTGSNAVTAYNGATFARDGVVCVSVNYRLGVEGFGYVADAPVPANRGLLDQIAALEWVRDNIAHFGGDPGNVTVAGESAGAMSVLTLLSLGTGLFHKAIAESGSAQIVQTREDAALVTAEVAERLRIEPTAEALAALPVHDLLLVQEAVSEDIAATADPERFGASTIASCGLVLMPVIDGELLHRAPLDALAEGAGQDTPLLMGTTTEEFRILVVPTSLVGCPDEKPFRDRLAAYGVPADFYDRYAEHDIPPYTRNMPSGIACAVLTDRMFRIPTIRAAEARADATAATYLFEFGWRTDTAPNPLGVKLGACHSLPLPFAWDTLDNPDSAMFTGDSPPQELADALHGRWVEFARTGRPAGWAPYDTIRRPVMVFRRDNEPSNETVDDPRGTERELWKDHLHPSSGGQD
ncbi:carboxylesterase/lipase family protein [Streptomyces sp. NA02950]|uniref:carboxylesterase/lipase family protein n=1 Tax=Streptomyces sp. NA02950 TaxID=2742137 RepID=UPI0015929A6A|nr:carboxylesterase family protein [Streptomyces sp. NA02950]QKV90875.1 carboxylesterase/lipase family protein [Streptomyces sp. NA02950]